MGIMDRRQKSTTFMHSINEFNEKCNDYFHKLVDYLLALYIKNGVDA